MCLLPKASFFQITSYISIFNSSYIKSSSPKVVFIQYYYLFHQCLARFNASFIKLPKSVFFHIIRFMSFLLI